MSHLKLVHSRKGFVNSYSPSASTPRAEAARRILRTLTFAPREPIGLYIDELYASMQQTPFERPTPEERDRQLNILIALTRIGIYKWLDVDTAARDVRVVDPGMLEAFCRRTGQLAHYQAAQEHVPDLTDLSL